MSLVHKEEIICPKCQTKGEFDFWDSMNMELNPELRESIFSEEAFIYACPKCGHRTGIPYDTLYHDPIHRFMILFSFFEPKDFDYKPFDLSDAPQIMEDYTYRHVNGLWELKEKILILEKGLNDVAIERMKYGIRHYEMPELVEKGIKIYFGDVRYDIEEYPDGCIIFLFEGEEESHQRVFPMNMYYTQCLACELDQRMVVSPFETIDEGWFSKKLKSGKV